MNTAVVKGEDFQTRMFERIKAQMGELMTDEELKKIVDAALQKAFFEPTVIITNPGHYTEKRLPGPSVFTSLVHDLMQENVKKLTKEWMEAHSEELEKFFKEQFDKGLMQMVVGAFQQALGDKFMQFQNGMIDMLRSMPR
jgi:hypothetical protein